MNTAHWHLALTHLPIVGIVIGTLTLLAAFIFKNVVVKRTALGIFIFSAFTAVPVFLTGEGAEDVVKNVAGATEGMVEGHEDLGRIFLILCIALGVLSILTFIADSKQNKLANSAYIFVLLIACVTCIFAKQVGTSGGEIRHTEIRSGTAAIDQQQNNAEQQGNNEKEDND